MSHAAREMGSFMANVYQYEAFQLEQLKSIYEDDAYEMQNAESVGARNTWCLVMKSAEAVSTFEGATTVAQPVSRYITRYCGSSCTVRG